MVEGFNDSGPEQASLRLGDLFEVAHRIRRLGIRSVEVDDKLEIGFFDYRFRTEVALSIEPWFGGGPGWYWYARIYYPSGGFSMGPVSMDRRALRSPQPRQVVRAYQRWVRWESGQLPVKRCS